VWFFGESPSVPLSQILILIRQLSFCWLDARKCQKEREGCNESGKRFYIWAGFHYKWLGREKVKVSSLILGMRIAVGGDPVCIRQFTTPICYKIALVRRFSNVQVVWLQLLSPGVWLIITFPATAPLAIIKLYCLMCVNNLFRDVTS